MVEGSEDGSRNGRSLGDSGVCVWVEGEGGQDYL